MFRRRSRYDRQRNQGYNTGIPTPAAAAAAAASSRGSYQLAPSAAAEAIRRHSLDQQGADAIASFPANGQGMRRTTSMTMNGPQSYQPGSGYATIPRSNSMTRTNSMTRSNSMTRTNSLTRTSTTVNRDMSGRTMSLTTTTVRQMGSFEITTHKETPMTSKSTGPRRVGSASSLRSPQPTFRRQTGGYADSVHSYDSELAIVEEEPDHSAYGHVNGGYSSPRRRIDPVLEEVDHHGVPAFIPEEAPVPVHVPAPASAPEQIYAPVVTPAPAPAPVVTPAPVVQPTIVSPVPTNPVEMVQTNLAPPPSMPEFAQPSSPKVGRRSASPAKPALRERGSSVGSSDESKKHRVSFAGENSTTEFHYDSYDYDLPVYDPDALDTPAKRALAAASAAATRARFAPVPTIRNGAPSRGREPAVSAPPLVQNTQSQQLPVSARWETIPQPVQPAQPASPLPQAQQASQAKPAQTAAHPAAYLAANRQPPAAPIPDQNNKLAAAAAAAYAPRRAEENSKNRGIDIEKYYVQEPVITAQHIIGNSDNIVPTNASQPASARFGAVAHEIITPPPSHSPVDSVSPVSPVTPENSHAERIVPSEDADTEQQAFVSDAVTAQTLLEQTGGAPQIYEEPKASVDNSEEQEPVRSTVGFVPQPKESAHEQQTAAPELETNGLVDNDETLTEVPSIQARAPTPPPTSRVVDEDEETGEHEYDAQEDSTGPYAHHNRSHSSVYSNDAESEYDSAPSAIQSPVLSSQDVTSPIPIPPKAETARAAAAQAGPRRLREAANKEAQAKAEAQAEAHAQAQALAYAQNQAQTLQRQQSVQQTTQNGQRSTAAQAAARRSQQVQKQQHQQLQQQLHEQQQQKVLQQQYYQQQREKQVREQAQQRAQKAREQAELAQQQAYLEAQALAREQAAANQRQFQQRPQSLQPPARTSSQRNGNPLGQRHSVVPPKSQPATDIRTGYGPVYSGRSSLDQQSQPQPQQQSQHHYHQLLEGHRHQRSVDDDDDAASVTSDSSFKRSAPRQRESFAPISSSRSYSLRQQPPGHISERKNSLTGAAPASFENMAPATNGRTYSLRGSAAANGAVGGRTYSLRNGQAPDPNRLMADANSRQGYIESLRDGDHRRPTVNGFRSRIHESDSEDEGPKFFSAPAFTAPAASKPEKRRDSSSGGRLTFREMFSPNYGSNNHNNQSHSHSHSNSNSTTNEPEQKEKKKRGVFRRLFGISSR